MPRPRLDSQPNLSLMGLRGIAALWVVAFHLRESAADMLPGVPLGVMFRGYLAVDVFFVLSGFVLTLHYSGRIRSLSDYGFFMQNRVARVYPLHLAILVALMVGVPILARLGLSASHAQDYVFNHTVLLHALLLHGWGVDNQLSWNGASWTISALFFAYLLFPGFDWLSGRLRGKWLLIAAIVVTLVATLLALRAAGHLSLHVAATRKVVLVRAGGEFLAGCLLCRVWMLREATWAGSDAIWSVVALAAIALGISSWGDPLMPFVACLLIYGLVSLESGAVKRLFESRFLVWLGTISLSIYLVHGPLVGVFRRLVPAPLRENLDVPGALSVLALAVGGILAVAWGAYHLVESPARQWLRARSRRAGGAGEKRVTSPDDREAS